MRLLLVVIVATFTAVALPGADEKRQTSKYTVGSSIQPLVIVGEGWLQRFTIINTDYYSKDETVGTLRFYTKDGQPWRVPLKDRGTVDHVDIALTSGQMVSLETVVSFDPQTLGWAIFELSADITKWGIYHALTVFRKQTAGQPDLMTSAAFVDSLEDEWIIPFDNSGGKYPGIALVNISTYANTAFLVTVLDSSGHTLRTFTKQVAPLNLAWFSLVGEYPDLASAQGQIKITGGLFNSALFTLQFAPNGAFTALPVVSTFGMQ